MMYVCVRVVFFSGLPTSLSQHPSIIIFFSSDHPTPHKLLLFLSDNHGIFAHTMRNTAMVLARELLSEPQNVDLIGW
jgi:hypothetical protein